MTTQRDEQNLHKLLRLNKQDLDQRQNRLADLQAAHASAHASLDWLAQSVRQEELKMAQRAQPDLAAMQGFSAGMDAKKSALLDTMETLSAEIDEARSLVQTAHQERQKLEHLLDRFQAAAKKKAAQKDAAAAQDIFARMGR